MFYLKNEYVLNSKADAFEAFDDLLSLIHCWLANQKAIKNEKDDGLLIGSENDQVAKMKDNKCDASGDPCFVHEMYHINHIRQKQCDCGKKGDVIQDDRNLFAETINIFNVLRDIDTTMNDEA